MRIITIFFGKREKKDLNESLNIISIQNVYQKIGMREKKVLLTVLIALDESMLCVSNFILRSENITE